MGIPAILNWNFIPNLPDSRANLALKICHLPLVKAYFPLIPLYFRDDFPLHLQRGKWDLDLCQLFLGDSLNC